MDPITRTRMLSSFGRSLARNVILAAALCLFAGTLVQAFAQRAPDLSQIQHFVFIVKENRSFDTYFGTFEPPPYGTTTATISTGEVVPLGHSPDALPRDLGHTGGGIFTALDWGRMDEFDISLGCSLNGDDLCLTQLTQADIPNYFSYATNFVLADQMFSSIASASFPNHLYTVGATSGGAFNNPSGGDMVWGCDSNSSTTVQTMNLNGDLFNQFPCFDFQTLADSLQSAGVSWTYYSPGQDQSGYQWNALDAINHIRNGPLWNTNIAPDTQFVTDAQAGNLPAVSWLVTAESNSEHPPHSSCAGENWTITQINAVMNGPDWNSTAIFVVWDDFGGFYDHYPPPASPDEYPVGPRVPMLIVSPFAIPGYISHTPYEFSSLLKIVEERYQLAPLTDRDADANDMLDSFNFNQNPNAPLILQTRSCPVASISSLNFSQPQVVGTPSPSRTVTVTDFDDASLTIDSITTTGDFSETNACGSGIKEGKECPINVTFSPTASGLRTGTLTINDSDVSSPQIVNLGGTGTEVTISPNPLSFGTIQQSKSKGLSATLTNNGSTTLNITSIVASGDFSETNTCGLAVAPGGQCTIRVSFTPTQTGLRYGSITVTDSDGSSPQILNLTGIDTNLSLSSKSLTFANQSVGTTSLPQPFTVINNGTSTLEISNIAVLGTDTQVIHDFSQTNNCGSSLAPNSSCVISVSFDPLVTGLIKGDIAIFNSEPGTSPLLMIISGTGTAAPIVTLNPTSLTFANQQVGTSSTPMPVTLMNTGSATLTISSVVASGDFSETDNCEGNFVAGAGCIIYVTFTPTMVGQRTGAITITDNAPSSPQVVPLSGTGTSSTFPIVTLSTNSLTFGNQPVGTTSTAQPITLTNTGTATLTITSIVPSGDFAESDNCNGSVLPNASCTLNVTFTPTALGLRTGSLTLTDNAMDSPQVASLAGTGTADPVPLLSQLAPLSTAPGGSGFTLTLDGAGFVPTSVVNWNGTALTTAFLSFGQLTANVPAADLANPATATVNVYNASTATTSNPNFLPITLGTTAVQLAQSVVTGANNPQAVALADFNGDGKMDAVVVNQGSNNLLVLLGNGDGTWAPVSSLPATGNSPSAVSVGDFNHDGKQDLAVTNRADNTLSILLGNGDGTFAPAAGLPATGNGPSSVASADLNDDGTLDLIVSNSADNTVSVLTGNGDGSFQAQTPYATGTGPGAVVVGDFNSDDKIDVALVNLGGTVSVLLGNGDGTLKGQVAYGAGTSPDSLVAADLNADGHLDLALANLGSNSLSVLLGNGDGTFQAHKDYPANSPRGVTSGDFNGDGKLDLAAVDSVDSKAWLLLGNGDGTLQKAVKYVTGLGPSAVAAGDFNNDGRLDLMATTATDNSITVLLQNPLPKLSTRALSFANQGVGTSSPPQPVTLTNNGSGVLVISSITLGGADPGDFSETNNCGTMLLEGASCTINLTFTPLQKGARSGTLLLNDNGSGSPQTVTLQGKGV